MERQQGVRPGSHDPPVPVLGDPEHLVGQILDLVGEVPLADAGAHQSTAFDLVEQLHRLGLCIEKPLDADGLRLPGGHAADAIRLP